MQSFPLGMCKVVKLYTNCFFSLSFGYGTESIVIMFELAMSEKHFDKTLDERHIAMYGSGSSSCLVFLCAADDFFGDRETQIDNACDGQTSASNQHSQKILERVLDLLALLKTNSDPNPHLGT